MLRAMHETGRFAMLGLLAWACACASAPSAQPAGTTAPPTPPPAESAPPLDLRVLGLHATFADLVGAARVLIRDGRGDSNAGCLLTTDRDTAAFKLAADLMPALDVLPDVPIDLDAQLQRTPGPARVLTAWGPAGHGEPELALTSFTALPAEYARGPVVVLVVTDAGVYVRFGNTQVSDEARGPLPIERAVSRAVDAPMLKLPGNENATFYVTAEAGVPLATLAQLLYLLPVDNANALAIVLPAGTKLPAPPPPAPSADSCPDGLPDLDENEPLGDLDRSAIVAALGPLQDAASECMRNATGVGRAGGKLVLALRVGRDGSVPRACTYSDPIGDVALATCVLSGARQLRFPPPNPPGSLDVLLPLSLSPIGPQRQQGLCAGTVLKI
jgi:hypothetical protein